MATLEMRGIAQR